MCLATFPIDDRLGALATALRSRTVKWPVAVLSDRRPARRLAPVRRGVWSFFALSGAALWLQIEN